MTKLLFREDAYLREAEARVIAHVEGGLVLDQTIFYPKGGGQPGDTGWLICKDHEIPVTNTVKGQGDHLILCIADDSDGSVKKLCPVGGVLRQRLDWDRRYAHMRVHTGRHLLSVVIPLGVTGGAITAPNWAAS